MGEMIVFVEVPKTKRAMELIEYFEEWAKSDVSGRKALLIAGVVRPPRTYGRKTIVGIEVHTSHVDKVVRRCRQRGIKPLFVW